MISNIRLDGIAADAAKIARAPTSHAAHEIREVIYALLDALGYEPDGSRTPGRILRDYLLEVRPTQPPEGG